MYTGLEGSSFGLEGGFMKRQKWRKSSRSAGGTIDECVEVSRIIAGPLTHIRDSKQGDGPQISTTPAGFDALLRMVCN